MMPSGPWVGVWKVATFVVWVLVTYVMYSPLQMAADLPEHYEKYDDDF